MEIRVLQPNRALPTKKQSQRFKTNKMMGKTIWVYDDFTVPANLRDLGRVESISHSNLDSSYWEKSCV